MTIYIEEMLGILESLEGSCDRLLRKFEVVPVSDDLLIDIESLEAKVIEIGSMLPDGITLGEWVRKFHWMKHWTAKKLPLNCCGDLLEFRDGNIAESKKKLQEWGSSLVLFDEELRITVKRLISFREFSSAIRQAFIILTERMRSKYNLQTGTDGAALVNEIFGQNSVHTAHMDSKHRSAMRDYLSGAYGLLRNKYAHGNPPLDLVELESTLATVNLALKLLK